MALRSIEEFYYTTTDTLHTNPNNYELSRNTLIFIVKSQTVCGNIQKPDCTEKNQGVSGFGWPSTCTVQFIFFDNLPIIGESSEVGGIFSATSC